MTISGLHEKKKTEKTWHQGLTPEILATQEAEIGKIMVPDTARQKVHETPISMKKKSGHDGAPLSPQLRW
jgi:hypothetical protein